MEITATKFTGVQVKELFTKAVGGIYFKRGYSDALTDIFKDYAVTEDGLRIDVKNYVTLNIPIFDNKQFINYAVAGEDDVETWGSSTYFDYKFCISGYFLCFNIAIKGTEITWEQLKELTDTQDIGVFEVKSQDTGALYIDIYNCSINVGDSQIEVKSSGANAVFDKDIINGIYNDSAECGTIIYRLEFNNGISDMEIEPKCRAINL